jgi:uridylate kinase
VDGVYSADPRATRFDQLTYDEILSRKLKVMDLTAITLARDSRIPVIVFSILSPGALTSVAKAQGRFTFIGA